MAISLAAGAVHAGPAGSTGVPAADVPQPQVESLDRFQAEQERLRKMLANRPKAYEDKVMDASVLPSMAEDDRPPDPDQTGFRGYVVETRMGTARSDSGLALRSATELGQRLEYRRETLNYGDFLVQLDWRDSQGAAGLGGGPLGYATEKSSARFTVRNLGFPITPSLFADTTVGDMSSEITDALTRAYRLSLGSGMVRGIGMRVFDGLSDLRVGFGARGNLAGGPYPGYERSQGSLAWAGYSRRLSGDTFAGLQVNQASGIPAYSAAGFTSLTDNVTSLAASVGYGSDLSLNSTGKGRLMYVRSQTSAPIADRANSAQGFFAEGGFRWWGLRHEMGAYSAEPNLRFGDLLLPADNRGAYWRMDGSSMRLTWGFGLSLEDQNPHRDPGRLAGRRLGLNANAQYRLNRDDTVGANVNLSRNRYDSGTNGLPDLGAGMRSVYASGYYQTRLAPGWGRSRLRLTLRRDEVLVTNGLPATGDEIEWEQDWIAGRYETQRPEFVTTLGLARDRSNGIPETRPTAGVVFRFWPEASWNIGGSLRYTARDSNLATSRGLSGTLDFEKVLQHGWRLGGTLVMNQATVNVASPVLGAPQVSRSNDKYASVYLRWEGSGGSSYQGAGLRGPGSAGGGSLDGIVYFDVNRDGEQQPGEGGVPNVEVILDGRYRVTTDRNGRFDFPLVGTGRHQLTLKLESVPLPWGAVQDRGVSVDVPLRGQATARIPVVRVGE
ncbi:hypothetical protein [Variovorax terrae]|uniref:SD-repeat containing protein B domain-containing protein n=1 Tax=Variovorax terrae TaxID=2923278 RepID=A0A9X1VVX4_9BURK|nr:hypothetical protein [Variovorax terrae]MCJ0764776.1 hypothetical protein [Variovorax terrae]